MSAYISSEQFQRLEQAMGLDLLNAFLVELENKPAPEQARVIDRSLRLLTSGTPRSSPRKKSYANEPDAQGPLVYLIQKGPFGEVKVGHTEGSARLRLASIQVSSPHNLYLRGCIAGDLSFERSLHRILRASRVRGEWFRPSASLALLDTYRGNADNDVLLDVRSRR